MANINLQSSLKIDGEVFYYTDVRLPVGGGTISATMHTGGNGNYRPTFQNTVENSNAPTIEIDFVYSSESEEKINSIWNGGNVRIVRLEHQKYRGMAILQSQPTERAYTKPSTIIFYKTTPSLY